MIDRRRLLKTLAALAGALVAPAACKHLPEGDTPAGNRQYDGGNDSGDDSGGGGDGGGGGGDGGY